MHALKAESDRDVAPGDPLLGEQTAHVAHVLAWLLPSPRYPEKLKSDLQGEAMIAVANCRRLAADWKGSRGALAAAKNLLNRGTGEPARQAGFLSIGASLEGNRWRNINSRKSGSTCAAIGIRRLHARRSRRSELRYSRGP